MKNDYSISSYRTTHFQYAALDKIHGEPTLDALVHVFRQLKINAQSVPTQLGGAQHGYLALVLNTSEYNAIPNAVPFRRPKDPGIFKFVPTTAPTTPTRPTTRSTTTLPGSPTAQSTTTPPTGTTTTQTPSITVEIAHQKAQHEEQKRQYLECQAVEQALRQQLIEAIEAEYLEALRDPITYMIQKPIPEIIEFLQTTYGQITPQELADREDALKNTVYDPSRPVDLIFNQITKFKELCELCHNTKTDVQLVQLAYLIFNKSRIFMDALKDWNKKATVDKTYDNMKQHMRAHYQDLKQVGALTVEDSALNDRANLLQEVTRTQEQFATDLKNDLQEQLKTNMVDAMLLLQQQAPHLSDTDTSTVTADSMNSATTTATLQTILNNMKTLQDEIATLKAQPSAPSQQDKSINPRTGKPWKRYCWTCGCCPHSSRYCPNKAPQPQRRFQQELSTKSNLTIRRRRRFSLVSSSFTYFK